MINILKRMFALSLLLGALHGCVSTVAHNEDGSLPANNVERKKYQSLIGRCFRTGGTRLVKISGELRCF